MITPLKDLVEQDIPTLQTERLTLRPFRLSDLNASAEMWADERTVRFIGAETRSRSKIWQQIQRTMGSWALLGYGYWAIEDRATGKFIGEAGFLEGIREIEPPFIGIPEAGWVLAPEAWGRGLASEAVAAITKWGDAEFGDLGMVCIIEPSHTASCRVAEKAGFKLKAETTYFDEPILIYERPTR